MDVGGGEEEKLRFLNNFGFSFVKNSLRIIKVITSLYEISLPEKYKAESLGLVLALYSKVAARFNISTPKLYLKLV